MGMGDIKAPFHPHHSKVWDAVNRLPFADILMRECPHPKVQEKYGHDCHVSVYVCRRCQFGRRHELFDGWSCSYAETK